MKKIKSFLIILISFLILNVVDAALVHRYGGLFGLFHINDEIVENQQPSPRANEIHIRGTNSNKLTINVEESRQLVVIDDIGSTKVNSWDYSWLSSDQNVATISSTGILIGKKTGKATLKVTSKNDVNLFDIVEVEVTNKDNTLRIDKSDTTLGELILNEVKRVPYEVGGVIKNTDLKWISTDESVVSVKDGYLYANGIGDAVIKVTSTVNPNYSDQLKVIVKDNSIKTTPINKVTINHIFINKKEIDVEKFGKQSLVVGDELIISASADTNNGQVVFSTENEGLKYISSDDYIVTYVLTEIGDTSIKVYSKYNSNIFEELKFKVTNSSKEINEFNLTTPIINNNSNLMLGLNEIQKVVIESESGIINFHDIEVEINDTTVISSIGNYLVPVGLGSTKVKFTYLYDNTKQIEFDVTVSNENTNIIPVEHISLSNIKLNGNRLNQTIYRELAVNVGDVLTFDVDVIPFDATYYTDFDVLVDSKIVVVTTNYTDEKFNVSIKFIENGKSNIEVVAFGAVYDSKLITVNVGNVSEEFDFNIRKLSDIIAGKVYSLELINQTGSNDVNYSYESSNPSILSIGPKGNIMALDKGEVEITVTATGKYKTLTKSITVNVEKEYKKYDRVTEMKIDTYTRENKEYVPIDFTKEFLSVYQKAYLKVTVNPNFNNANNYEVISSNSDVIAVSYVDYMYQLLALKAGTATITVKNYEDDSLTVSFEIKVYDVLPKYFIPILESDVLTIGKNESMSFIVDDNATYTKTEYTFSTSNVVEIKQNQLIPLNEGETTMIVKITDDHTTYELSIPIKVIIEKEKGISDYGVLELIVFIAFNVIISIIFGYYLINIVKIIKVKRSNKIIIIAILILMFVLIPFIIQLNVLSTSINIIKLTIKLISMALGGSLYLILSTKRGEKNEN